MEKLLDCSQILHAMDFYFSALKDVLGTQSEITDSEIALQAFFTEYRQLATNFQINEISLENINKLHARIVFFSRKVNVYRSTAVQTKRIFNKIDALSYSVPFAICKKNILEYDADFEIEFENFWCSFMSRQEQSWYKKMSSKNGEEHGQDEDEMLKMIGEINDEATLIIKRIEMDEEKGEVIMRDEGNFEERRIAILDIISRKLNKIQHAREMKRVALEENMQKLELNEAYFVSTTYIFNL